MPEMASPVEQNLPPLRYAILNPTTSVNIWSLFDKEGASYENYAVKGEYWPRLYHLAAPNNELTPLLADGFPSLITQEGEFLTATLTLLPDLTWSDGSPLSATDVAFTVNTALEFELGLNWAVFYNKKILHHLEAIDAQTIKYYFSSIPNAGDWQQGALIGVFASQSYWEPKVAEVKKLLPLTEDNLLMAEYQIQIDALQAEAEIIAENMPNLNQKSTEYRAHEKLLIDRQFRRDSFKKKLELAQREKREKFTAARAALYALDDAREPLAGLWQLSAEEEGYIENIALVSSHFETTRYTLYQRDAAIQALLANETDFILTPHGLTSDDISHLSEDPAIHFTESRRNNIRFLAFNHNRTPLDDIALRHALSCLIDPEFLATEILDGAVNPALGWVHPENIGWYPGQIEPPCTGLDADARLAAGVRQLKMAGYLWEQEPSPNHAGKGLKIPSGEDFPSITIIAPSDDPSRANAAIHIEAMVRSLGIPITAESIPADDLFFAVYGGGDYDLAIVGWSLSLFPDYLCDFFSEGNFYNYSNAAVNTKCTQFLRTSDISQAREQLFQIEVYLLDDLPAVPLFSTKVTEAYRNFSLPFDGFLDGFGSGLYGAPALLKPEK